VEAVVPPPGLFENGEYCFHHATCASSASGMTASCLVGVQCSKNDGGGLLNHFQALSKPGSIAVVKLDVIGGGRACL